MSIERLSLIDTVTASTNFAVNVNGQDYRVLAQSVYDYIVNANEEFGGGGGLIGGKTIQYFAPSATGWSVAIAAESESAWLVITPTAGFATGTITLPALINVQEGQEVLVNCTQSVGTLTVLGNGANVIGAPTSLAANGFFLMKFEPILSNWYRVG
jgi:hypothetical protein